MARITGSRVEVALDGAVFRKRMSEQAELNFGAIPHGDVDVGPLQPVDAPTSSQDDDR